jgi:hypothetical protein
VTGCERKVQTVRTVNSFEPSPPRGVGDRRAELKSEVRSQKKILLKNSPVILRESQDERSSDRESLEIFPFMLSSSKHSWAFSAESEKSFRISKLDRLPAPCSLLFAVLLSSLLFLCLLHRRQLPDVRADRAAEGPVLFELDGFGVAA